MIRILLTVLIALFSFRALPALAAEVYTLDKPHTQILFTIDHLGFSQSTGKFLDYSGSFMLDRLNPENSSVNVTINTDSLDLGDRTWNEHMKKADFFNVAAFPVMTFRSTSVSPTGSDTADVAGDLTILGVTRPVVLKVRHNKSGPLPFGEKFVAGFNAETTIKRSDFGMDYGLPMVGDDVAIRISAEGVQEGYQGASKGKE